MRRRTSITLSEDLLAQLSAHLGPQGNRSEFVEEAIRVRLREQEREAKARLDAAIPDRNADALNAEAEDVLSYQADP